MEKQKPLVSVIVRTKDRPILLGKAVKSISDQTYRPVEVVLINDGGLDVDIKAISNILGDITLTYQKLEKNTGRAHAGNTGIEMSQGKYICFLDDDDLFYCDHINILLNVLEEVDYQVAYTDANIVYRDYNSEEERILEREKRLFTSKDFSYEELLIDNYIPLICIMFRREILKLFQGFDENFELYEDWDLLLRIGEKYPFYHIPKITVDYVQWSRNLQISQSPLFFNKAEAYHNQIILKHKNKYSSNIIMKLVQKRRMLSEKENIIKLLEIEIEEDRDRIIKLEQELNERQRETKNLEESLFLSNLKIEEIQKILENKNGFINELSKDLDDTRKCVTRLENINREKETELNNLRHELEERNVSLLNAEERIVGLEAEIRQANNFIKELSEKVNFLENTVQQNNETIKKKEHETKELEIQINGLREALHDLDMKRIDLKRTILEKDAFISGLEEQILSKNTLISQIESVKNELQNILKKKDEELSRIFSSNGWKGLMFYYKVRDKILPPYTRRRSIVKRLGHKIINIFLEKVQKKETTENMPGFHEINKNNNACQSFISGVKTEISEISINNYQKFNEKKKVLVTGVYLANQENTIEHIVDELSKSEKFIIEQKWIALYGISPSKKVESVTFMKQDKPEPKFVLLNKILSQFKIHQYDYILFCDDDIKLVDNFLDRFLELQEKYDFALAQPARTHNSFIDHPFVEQLDGITARRTRFVEIGPVFSVRKDAFPILIPFDESSFMGWGYDFVWPCFIEKMGLRMGIIDAVPVEHSLRKPVMNYNYDEANKAMLRYLSKSPHLSKEEAFRILESYV